MSKSYRLKLGKVIDELEFFLYKDFSSKFKTLTEKEDRQLFFLARQLVKLKRIRDEIKEDEKILIHPVLREHKGVSSLPAVET